MKERFGRLEGGRLVPAPASLETADGVVMNPTPGRYLAEGWKRIFDDPPEAEEGRTVEPTGWSETATTLTRTYRQLPVKATAPSGMPADGAAGGPRVFSKLKLVVALKREGLWVLTKTWIEEQGLYDLYLAAQDVREDNEWFVRGLGELKALSRRTDAEVEAILAECTAD